MCPKIQIESFISSYSYFFEQEKSRCYIVNDKKHSELMLEGVFADLWNVIFNTLDYEKANIYAKKRNVEKYLEDFFEELKFTGLIQNNDYPESKEFNVSTKVDNSVLEYDKMFSDKVAWIAENNFLVNLFIELSYNCNLNCKHCFNDKSNIKEQIDFEDVKKIIDSAINLGVNNITFTSGECTLHPDFIKILRYIRSKRKSFSFTTNGQKLYDDNEFFEEVVKLYPHLIRISLYSMDPSVHDGITGVLGSCKKTVEVIRKLHSRNIPVRINYFQMSLNKESLDDILRFREEIGVGLSVDIFFMDNHKNNNSYARITDEQIYDYFKGENAPYSHLLEYKNDFSGEESSPCGGAVQTLSVSPSLDVYPCVSLKYKIGNLKETSLDNIWNNEHKRFLSFYKVKNLIDCKKCDDFQMCMYCPCMGMYENGFLKKSDICCKITEIRKKVLKEKHEKRKIEAL